MNSQDRITTPRLSDLAYGDDLDERIARKQPVLHQLLLDTQEGREVLALVREARAVVAVANMRPTAAQRFDQAMAARERGEGSR